MVQNLSSRERNLIKGAIRRVFSRSDLRRSVIDAAIIDHYDPSRPRVTKWVVCSECNKPTPKYLAEVDHIDPIIPVDKTLEDLTWDELIKRVFCSKDNLTVKDKVCHSVKTKLENKQRAAARKERKNVKRD